MAVGNLMKNVRKTEVHLGIRLETGKNVANVTQEEYTRINVYCAEGKRKKYLRGKFASL